MKRTPEQELMIDEAQVLAYAGADLSDINQPLVDQFRRRFTLSAPARVLDLGCGAADVAIRLLRTLPGVRAVGVDASEAMLSAGRKAVAAANLDGRITLERRRLPDPQLNTHSFDAVVSSNLLHHLEDPAALWEASSRAARAGAAIMVLDLRRPVDGAAAAALVERYAGDAAPLVKRDFLASLYAAYTAEEVRAQIARSELRPDSLDEPMKIEELGDLHLLVWGHARHRPGAAPC